MFEMNGDLPDDYNNNFNNNEIKENNNFNNEKKIK